jgi:hypothetical protein
MSSAQVKPKKNRKFGFKGGIRKKTKKEDKPVVPKPADDGDDSTVYSVAFDAATASKSNSVSNLESARTPIGDPIHVILLLMDPKTRRFELLQLEFDSSSATVSDIFTQIAVSATEPTLKSQQYETLIDLKGYELIASKNLAEYIDSAGIVIAVPATTKEDGVTIAKMATPILSNPKVHTMLASSGLEIADLPEPAVKPVKQPEKMRSEVEAAPSAPARSEEQTDFSTVSKPMSAPEPPAPFTTKPAPKSSINVFALAAFAVVAHLILKVHIHYTTPLGPGDVLAPGRSRGMCGLNSLSPFSECESASMTMGEDGVFQVVKAGEVVYELTGKDCDQDCVPGLSIDKDGKVTINGARVKTTIKASAELQPWPFSEDVYIPRTFM